MQKGLVLYKFGGTSVGDPNNTNDMTRIKMVATFLASRHEQGEKPCVVISAMGNSTDNLISLARNVADNPSPDELDALMATGEMVSSSLLAIALNNIGVKAMSVNGSQMGMLTDGNPGEGRIVRIERSDWMRQMISEGIILICAGFQGTRNGRLHTLGRGGSNTSAAAIAHAIGALLWVNCTDVGGVYTFDPRLQLSRPPHRFGRISYDHMLAMSIAGAGVLKDRAVALAQTLGMPIQVTRSPSLSDHPTVLDDGTLITSQVSPDEIEGLVSRAALPIQRRASIITVDNLSDEPGSAASIFGSLPEDVVIGDCFQGDTSRQASLSFWIERQSLERTLSSLKETANKKGWDVRVRHGSALTLVDPRMSEGTGYFRRMTQSLAKAGVNIGLIGSSGNRITVMIEEGKLIPAAEALAQEFNLFEDE